MNSVEELAEFIQEKLNGNYDYNRQIEAIADITKAAFDLATDKLGASGWTPRRAELNFIAKSRRITGPFAIIEADDMLYPQTWDHIPDKYRTMWLTWAQEEAARRLEYYEGLDSQYINDEVRQHWIDLVEGRL